MNAWVSLDTTALLGDTSLVYFFSTDSVGRTKYNKDRGEMKDTQQGWASFSSTDRLCALLMCEQSTMWKQKGCIKRLGHNRIEHMA